MKPIVSRFLIAALACAPSFLVQAQSPSPAETAKAAAGEPAARTDLYHVHFAKAATGKAAQLSEELLKPQPDAPMPGHFIVLRHEDGDSWDFVVIEHLGSKATIEAKRPAIPAATRDLWDWHNDTYVNGPSWAEFSKALGMESKDANAVYIVSTYRAVSGQRDALEKFLSEPPNPAKDSATGDVLLQHLEGSPWNFVAVTRYNSWEDFAKSEKAIVAETAQGKGGWFKLRELIASHTDTIALRVSK